GAEAMRVSPRLRIRLQARERGIAFMHGTCCWSPRMLASHGSERRHPGNRENQTARLPESTSDVREQFWDMLSCKMSIEHATSMSLAPSGDSFVWPDDCAQ